MSRPQRMLALAFVVAALAFVVAALMGLGMANADGTDRDRKQSLYTCTVWNDRSWAGCP